MFQSLFDALETLRYFSSFMQSREHNNPMDLATHLDEVRKLIIGCAAETPLFASLAHQASILAQGKMLRARLALYVANILQSDYSTTLRCAAAVELIHAASLLHDDVIDGGTVRRGAPALWMEKGIPAAILMGDLLLFKALELVHPLEGGRILGLLIRLTGEMVAAETEQELVLRGQRADWQTCARIARHKTGPLFAFAAAATATDNAQREALTEAGFLAGTAYQLSDDVLDAFGDPEVAGKTLGLDALRKKSTWTQLDDTAADPIRRVWQLCDESAGVLAAYPQLRATWEAYLSRELMPAIQRNVEGVRA